MTHSLSREKLIDLKSVRMRMIHSFRNLVENRRGKRGDWALVRVLFMLNFIATDFFNKKKESNGKKFVIFII